MISTNNASHIKPLCAISRHTVVCRAAKKAGDHTVSIFTGRKKKQLPHACIAPWPLLQSTLFLHYSCPPSRVRHTANLIKFVIAICEMQTCNSIALTFGTNEERVMADSCTKSVVNLSNIQGVMNIYSPKKDQTSVTATG